MSVVHEGVPNGEKIMQLFGGDAKKKVFLYWSQLNILEQHHVIKQLKCYGPILLHD